MGEHASVLVVDKDRTSAAYAYEHYDGRYFIQDLLQFATTRNSVNAWECRGSEIELWPVTPTEFVTRFAQERLHEHHVFGRTGSGIETRLEVDPNMMLATEYAHLVIVDGTQVISVRRIHDAQYGQGDSYTITFDPAPVTRTLEDTAQKTRPSIHEPQGQPCAD